MINNCDLRAIRRSLHYTIKSAAKEIGIAPSTLWSAEVEAHETGALKLKRIIEFYETKLEEKKNHD